MPTISAPAKINLSLEVTGKRRDGYHDLVSVMQEVTLADQLTLRDADDLHLDVDIDCGPVENNLVIRAARALSEASSVSPHAAIHLRKQIPVGAGLGGGSSDAASCLVALNRLWRLHVPCGRLLAIAARLGSDVPFFLTGGTALVTGRGEDICPLPFARTQWYVLTNPGFHVSTARIFSALAASDWTSGEMTFRMAARLSAGLDAGPGMNTLQRVLFRLYPAAEECFRAVDRLAPGRSFVSGSGPTVVSQWLGPEEAEAAAAALCSLGYRTWVVRNCATEDRELPCRA
jgi:4-diphosphocytidyl-2-C-methyl-D-erythritol kinase